MVQAAPILSRSQAAPALAALAHALYARGWCSGTSGNFSAVLARDPLELLVTHSGVAKHALREDELVAVDALGRALPGESGRPSAETLLHVAVAEGSGAGSVLHTHSVAATLLGERFREKGGFTIAGYEMQKGLAGIATHEAEVFVPVLPNSQDVAALAAEVQRLFDEHSAMHGFLLASHGLYTWGVDVEAARRHVEILEFLFELLLRRTDLEPFVG